MDKKYDDKKDFATSHVYFSEHQCQVPPEQLTKYEIKCSDLRRFWLHISSVDVNYIRALSLYRSHAALSEEKYRNYRYFPLSIHPYSKLRHWLEATFVIALTLSNVSVAIHFADDDPKNDDCHTFVIYSIDLLYLLNVLANVFTGYIDGNTNKVAVMDLKRIWCRYARTWLVIDLVSSVCCLGGLLEKEFITLQLVLVAMKMLRLPVLIKYLDNVLIVRRTEIIRKTTLELTLLTLSYITWNIYFQFATEYIAEGSYVPVNPRNCSWLTIGKLWQHTTPTRLGYSFDRAVGMLRNNANMNLINEAGCFETFFIISWLIAKLLIYHCALKYTISVFGLESAQAKYYIMMKQVETYMNHRNFPPRIKQKILKFYAIRFQSNFYRDCHTFVIYSIDLLYLLNVLANVFTGYIDGNTNKVAVMDLKRIWCRYARTWLVIDLVSSVCCLGGLLEKEFITLQLVLVAMKMLRLPVLIKYLDNVLIVRRTEESRILSSVSDHLREDIVMHTGRQLVRELTFLKQLPKPLLSKVALKLKLVIFIAGDIIFKINTPGDCVYFIDKGTVAIYSESGKEIWHREDGDYFGAISMVSTFGRTVSAIAVTNCELFRLNKQDFDSTIALYPTVYEDVKKEAITRYEKGIVLDEHHKAELKIAGEDRNRQNLRDDLFN